MKYVFIILSILITNDSCENAKQSENVSFEYSAHSRGFYNLIKVNKNTISFQKRRNEMAKTKDISEANWNSLTQLLSKINLSNLSHLEAPSNKSHIDAAGIANLTIKVDDTIYETNSFDHGNPPKEIETLVKELLSLAQNIE